jgi:predicted CoA-binding protein
MTDPAACDLTNRPGAMKQAHPPTAGEIASVLKAARTVAVIGLSDDPAKPAYGVSATMKRHGYRIIPVHPKAQTALGEKAYPSLAAIPFPVELVTMFRGADAAPGVVDEAIAKGAKAFWMPEGVVHEEAAAKARAAGLVVVMDRCVQKELAAR